jgi:hypothetical protein
MNKEHSNSDIREFLEDVKKEPLGKFQWLIIPKLI